MTESEKKIRIVLHSHQAATGVISYDVLLPGPFGRMYRATKQMTVYERVLDEDQKAMLEEARKFSCLSGIELEAVDLGRKNLLSRIVWNLTRKFEDPPSLVFRGNIPFQLLLSSRRAHNGAIV